MGGPTNLNKYEVDDLKPSEEDNICRRSTRQNKTTEKKEETEAPRKPGPKRKTSLKNKTTEKKEETEATRKPGPKRKTSLKNIFKRVDSVERDSEPAAAKIIKLTKAKETENSSKLTANENPDEEQTETTIE